MNRKIDIELAGYIICVMGILSVFVGIYLLIESGDLLFLGMSIFGILIAMFGYSEINPKKKKLTK